MNDLQCQRNSKVSQAANTQRKKNGVRTSGVCARRLCGALVRGASAGRLCQRLCGALVRQKRRLCWALVRTSACTSGCLERLLVRARASGAVFELQLVPACARFFSLVFFCTI